MLFSLNQLKVNSNVVNFLFCNICSIQEIFFWSFHSLDGFMLQLGEAANVELGHAGLVV